MSCSLIESDSSDGTDTCIDCIRRQSVIVKQEVIKAYASVDPDGEDANAKGLLWARTQASKRRSALLEKCYIFNCGVIEYLEAHQQDVLLQLEDCAATLFRLMGLQDAKQQAALVRELAAGVLDVCTPWQREEMQVEVPLQLERALANPPPFENQEEEEAFLDMYEDAQAEAQKERCYSAHNWALYRARRAQGRLIDQLLLSACRPKLIRHLAAKLEQCSAIKPYAACAVLDRLRGASFLLPVGDDSLLHDAAAAGNRKVAAGQAASSCSRLSGRFQLAVVCHAQPPPPAAAAAAAATKNPQEPFQQQQQPAVG